MKYPVEDITSFNQILTAGDIAHIAIRMLSYINKKVATHTIKTAYLVYHIAMNYQMDDKCSLDKLMLLSFFHTLGFFREDPFFQYNPHDSDHDYFTDKKSISSKYHFAAYYLEYMSPLHKDARALANFTKPYNEQLAKIRYQEDYKSIIYFSARICDYLEKNETSELPTDLNCIAPGYFNPNVVNAFLKANANNLLVLKLNTENYRHTLSEYLLGLSYNDDDTKRLESLLVYFLDFKSTQTMKHAINTSCYAVSLGKRMNLDHDELSTLFTSAALHDIGKIATPQRILEFPGKLSPEDMGIMRHHVNHSKRILEGFVPYDILYNVYRHHEKLNGTGYPRKIKGEEITKTQRILTVADITSALNDNRSYKGEFSKDKTVSIIQSMTENGELDASITKCLIDDFDDIIEEQKELQEIMKVNFSNVLADYNAYLLSEPDDILETLDSPEEPDELDTLEEL